MDFDGRLGNPALDWLFDLERCCKWDQNLTRAVFADKMNLEPCKSWYDALAPPQRNLWGPLKGAFLQKFVPKRFYKKLLRYLGRKKQLEGQSVDNYYLSFDKLLKKLGNHCPEDEEVCSHFRKGLRSSLRKRLSPDMLAEDFNDLQLLLNQARSIEEAEYDSSDDINSALLEGVDVPVHDTKARNHRRNRRHLHERSSGGSSDEEDAQQHLMTIMARGGGRKKTYSLAEDGNKRQSRRHQHQGQERRVSYYNTTARKKQQDRDTRTTGSRQKARGRGRELKLTSSSSSGVSESGDSMEGTYAPPSTSMKVRKDKASSVSSFRNHRASNRSPPPEPPARPTKRGRDDEATPGQDPC